MDFDVEIKKYLNMLLEEFDQYKRQNQCDRKNLIWISNQASQYFKGLSQDFSNVLTGLDTDYKVQEISSINESTEILNNHFERQQ